MALVTTARAQLDPLLATLDSTLLASYLEAATEMIEGYCDRTFARATYTELLNGNGLHRVTLANAPIASVTSVTIDDSLSTGTLDIDASTGIIESTKHFTKGWQNVSIVYVGGYADIPDAVQVACIQMARSLAGVSLTSKDPSLKSEKMGEYAYARATGGETTMVSGNASVMALLSSYVSIRGL